MAALRGEARADLHLVRESPGAALARVLVGLR
jgi:hypothetical protein